MLIDTNVLLDVLTDDPRWLAWSLHQLGAAALAGPLLINDIVYAELSVGFSTLERTDAAVAQAGVELVPIPRAALFLAGKVFRSYRSAGGSRSGVLPDFFIGAHASVLGIPLLTRDPRRYRTYFPRLQLVTP